MLPSKIRAPRKRIIISGLLADNASRVSMSPATPQLNPEIASGVPVRVVTAAALFDGHDASINIIRRLLQSLGAEVIHLGHDRSVGDVVTAVIQEDADAVAISSYQGGHIEYFRYLIDELRAAGMGHVRVYGGGGGVIAKDEIDALHAYGVTRIFSPEDGQKLGLKGMVAQIVDAGSPRPPIDLRAELARLAVDQPVAIARLITHFECGVDANDALHTEVSSTRQAPNAPVVGFTGTGGAGKSSLVDELVRRFRREFPTRSVAVLSVDPTRRRSGGALLGDRIRMNAVEPPQVYVRSLATRQANRALSKSVTDAIAVLQATGFDLIIVETAGIGQSDSEIVDLVDISSYVMTPEYGAASQLEKIDMLDLADLVVLNKFDRRGGEDALRDIRKQWRRNHEAFEMDEASIPVYASIASRWADPGTDRLYQALMAAIAERGFAGFPRRVVPATTPAPAEPLVPASRTGYLREISDVVRHYHSQTDEQAGHARDLQALRRANELMDATSAELSRRCAELETELDADLRQALEQWPETRARYSAESQSYQVRDREIAVENYQETLSRLQVPRVALPQTETWGELTQFLRRENLPGRFPFTAGVFPFKRSGEEGTARMFAGEGTPERTNARFHLLSQGQPAARLSTAFDSVTLYGRDAHERPDIYGKVGTSGVSVCTLEDAKKLYSGFDLADPKTSVSMTINGPAPVILAFFLNAAIDQAVEKHLAATGRLDEVRQKLATDNAPRYAGELPPGHSGLGLSLLGVSGDQVVDAETYASIRSEVLRGVRGTVQADILKEDQAQNTCIFSTEFALRMMGDIQSYFCREKVSNFYSVSISGYHIAEAGANPISQLAFTLANGFTYCEYYKARGLEVDEFAPNFSFFFSNGLDPEYTVIGRVARRIWAIALRECYGASERSQKLKYHIQTSGRSLHAQEMNFNDIRTTLQALLAVQDHCNSLHTNAFDEAVTTPTEDSVRRALAIQLIINREFGSLMNENPIQGAYWTDFLTDLVEQEVLREFERISDRGGVLGAMETMYQRGKIQEESLHYEQLKHSGELPVVGVNTFQRPEPEPTLLSHDLIRGTDEERHAQLRNVQAFRERHLAESVAALQKLQEIALQGGNVFEELMETVKVASLGQIVDALFEVGGQYRRAM